MRPVDFDVRAKARRGRERARGAWLARGAEGTAGAGAFQREPRRGDRAVAEPCHEARTSARVGAGAGEAAAASARREARRRRKGNRVSR